MNIRPVCKILTCYVMSLFLELISIIFSNHVMNNLYLDFECAYFVTQLALLRHGYLYPYICRQERQNIIELVVLIAYRPD